MGKLVKAALAAQQRLAIARGEQPEGTDAATLFVATLNRATLNREQGSMMVKRSTK